MEIGRQQIQMLHWQCLLIPPIHCRNAMRNRIAAIGVTVVTR